MTVLFQSAAGAPSFSVELKDPAPFGWVTPAGTKTLLQTGYYGVQLSTVNPFERTFTCQTNDIADIVALEGIKGEFGDLVIDGVTACTHVGITGSIVVTPFGKGSAFAPAARPTSKSYEYTVTFTQAV